MHVHLGVHQGVAIFAYVIIFGFFWRVAAAKLHDTALGKAMAFAY